MHVCCVLEVVFAEMELTFFNGPLYVITAIWYSNHAHDSYVDNVRWAKGFFFKQDSS